MSFLAEGASEAEALDYCLRALDGDPEDEASAKHWAARSLVMELQHDAPPRSVLVWADLKATEGKTRTGDALARLPQELLDAVLADDTLTLRDHLALAGTCRALRSCYTEQVFEILWKSKKNQSLIDLWRQQGSKAPLRLSTLWSGRHRSPAKPADPVWRAQCIITVNSPLITKSEAKRQYKVSDRDLANLKCDDQRKTVSQQGKRMTQSGHKILYRETAVEALALKAHGGAWGHIQHERKCAEIAAKRAATRKQNEKRDAAQKAKRESATKRAAEGGKPAAAPRGPALDYDPYGHGPDFETQA